MGRDRSWGPPPLMRKLDRLSAGLWRRMAVGLAGRGRAGPRNWRRGHGSESGCHPNLALFPSRAAVRPVIRSPGSGGGGPDTRVLSGRAWSGGCRGSGCCCTGQESPWREPPRFGWCRCLGMSFMGPRRARLSGASRPGATCSWPPDSGTADRVRASDREESTVGKRSRLVQRLRLRSDSGAPSRTALRRFGDAPRASLDSTGSSTSGFGSPS
jgi:hypothetical protein